VQQTRWSKDKPVNRIELKQERRWTTWCGVCRRLRLGADVISILQAMKAAGALEAELEVL